MHITVKQIVSRVDDFGTLYPYSRMCLTTHITKVMVPSMILRRLGPTPDSAYCSAGRTCPDIFEMSTGDFAIIGADITEQASRFLPSDAGCGPGERIVRIPRRTLIMARSDIPGAV